MNELTYNGITIRDRGEMLNLTDMWRSAKRDPSKTPSRWRKLPSVQEFCEHVAAITGRKSPDELFQALNEGGERNTWAHWQPALAYAKYLSPELHAEANKVWRAQIEGKLVQAPVEQSLEERLGIGFRALQELTEKQAKKIEEIEPGHNAWQLLSKSSGSLCLSDAAKELKIKPKEFIGRLNKMKWIFLREGSGHWVGYQNRINDGDLEHVPFEYMTKDGPRCGMQVKVTSQGMAKLAKLFSNNTPSNNTPPNGKLYSGAALYQA